jgi:cephalosporin-C deacetylase-like acetyl esterase
MSSYLTSGRQFLIFAAFFWTAVGFAGPTMTVTPNKKSAVYQTNENIIWQINVHGDQADSIKQAAVTLKKGGATVIDQGIVNFNSGTTTIQTALHEPETILAEVAATNSSGGRIQAWGGVAIAPDQIKPSSPCPADFDSFWQSKLKELAAVPEHAMLKKENSDRAETDYWKITLDNIRGTHIQGQMARPASGKKFPAMLIVQSAGVYPLQKRWVTDRAAEGWLALNIMAHDLPIDQPPAFYKELSETTLKSYPTIGDDDREKSYFLRMFLACYRAAEYLSEQPDWDGKTLIVTGASQGGLQSFAAAALNSKITAVLAVVPAGCDNTGAVAGRTPGWPYWMPHAADRDPQKVFETSRYFDGINFAARIHCPALIGLGLIDTTSAASGVFAAINQLRGPKEIIVMPNANHHGDNHTQAPFFARADAWREALLQGRPIPIK